MVTVQTKAGKHNRVRIANYCKKCYSKEEAQEYLKQHPRLRYSDIPCRCDNPFNELRRKYD